MTFTDGGRLAKIVQLTRLPSPALAARLRIIPVYTALFCAIGVSLPYWPTWLEGRELSPEVIGVLLGVGPWVRFGLNPPLGRFADRHALAHRLVLVGALIMAFSYVGLHLAGTSLPLIAGLVLISAIGFGPIVPLLDSVVLRTEGVDYGRVRGWGSAAFIVASFVGGLLLDAWGPEAILSALFCCSIAMLLTGLALPAPRPRTLTAPEHASAEHASAWQTPGFAVVLGVVALLNGSHAALYGFGTLHWQSTGISDANIGVLWSVSVLSEILLFVVGARLRVSVGLRGLLLLASAGGVLRWTLLAGDPGFAVLLAAQTLHACTFAAMHLAMMDFVQRHVAPEATAHATSLYSAIATGITLGVLMPLSGLLYAQLAGGAFYFMAGISGLALVASFFARFAAQSRHTPT